MQSNTSWLRSSGYLVACELVALNAVFPLGSQSHLNCRNEVRLATTSDALIAVLLVPFKIHSQIPEDRFPPPVCGLYCALLMGYGPGLVLLEYMGNTLQKEEDKILLFVGKG